MLIGLIFVAACSHPQLLKETPSWVQGLRSGEESLKVVYGSKHFYRRLAGSSSLSKDASCSQAVALAETDIKKEFPYADKIPYSLDALFYDETHKDCAVTVSVLSAQRNKIERVPASEDEATELVQKRTETAIRFALTGLTKAEFEKFSQENVKLISDAGICYKGFKTQTYSIHGLTQICWKEESILGYCSMKDSLCWKKTP